MLEPVFQWLASLEISQTINQSLWAFAVIQAFHLVALAVLIGSVLIVDLRLLGGLGHQPLAQLARDARPWLVGALIAMVFTGMPQLMSNAMRVYYSEWFWIKMTLLAIAIVFTFTLRHRVTQLDESRLGAKGRIVGLVSIGLWMAVAINGRLIGLF